MSTKVESETLDLKTLRDAIAGTAAAFRYRGRLQPAGGQGDKVFPPTYAGAVYATEKRRVPGRPEPVECVLLDSVQSQANRMEEALQKAIDDGRLEAAGVQLPVIEVDFGPFWDPEKKNNKLNDELRLLDPVGKISALQAPHRIADAILRDSIVEEDGKPFRARDPQAESVYGQRLRRVSSQDANVLFELCPTALLFGMWDSTGPKGGLGAKFERALVSEIVGIDAAYGVKTSSRIDPLAIQRGAGPVYVSDVDAGDLGWTLDAETKAKREKGKPVLLGKDGRPSEANHGNIAPSISEYDRAASRYLAGGVTIDYAEQSVVLSLAALRRLRFPINGETAAAEANQAAQTVLAALGLCAAALAAEAGFDLRSRCLLWPDTTMEWELLANPGSEPTKYQLNADAAIQLLKTAIDAAKKAKLPWRETVLKLRPSDELVKLVVKSQHLAIQQGDESGEGDA